MIPTQAELIALADRLFTLPQAPLPMLTTAKKGTVYFVRSGINKNAKFAGVQVTQTGLYYVEYPKFFLPKRYKSLLTYAPEYVETMQTLCHVAVMCGNIKPESMALSIEGKDNWGKPLTIIASTHAKLLAEAVRKRMTGRAIMHTMAGTQVYFFEGEQYRREA